MPSVPTMIEGGVPDYEAVTWYALLAPANTPNAIVGRLNSETVQVMRAEDVRERLSAQGLDPVGSTPQELALRIREDIKKWSRVVQSSGAKID